MAIIVNSKGQYEVEYTTLQDIKNGFCVFCDAEDSDIKQVGHYTFICRNCDTEFVYKGR
jgi:hypothetical protein